MSFYRQRLNSDDEPLYDNLSFPLLYRSRRRTYATECVHKQMASTFKNLQQGCAMLDYRLAELTNRYNQVICKS